jgi:pilus assembly protein CpaF
VITEIKQQFVGEAQDLIDFMEDETITDLLVNGIKSLYIEREGKLEQVINPFSHELSLFSFIERLIIPSGKPLDGAAPFVDGRLLDGSRFNIILPPLAEPGPLISIRKRKTQGRIPLFDFGPEDLINWIIGQIKNQKTFLISGGTGTGKTTFLASLIAECLFEERICLIEEVIEIDPPHPHLIHLESRPPSPDGRGGVSLGSLVSTALRIRPDRIIVGECRGEEAFDMLQAMNTGHGGSLGTLHANSALDALRRFESLALMKGLSIPLKVIRDWIGAHIFGVIHLERCQGIRRISEVLRVNGLEGEVYRVQPQYRL